MIIVDFNGLPGCGKSTYVNELYKNITSKGYKCYLFNKNEYMDLYNTENKINDYIRMLIFPNFIYCIKLLLKWKSNKFDRKISVKEKIWKTLRIVILNDKIHKLSRKEEGILLIDQGIIQDYADFFIDKELNENNILSYVNKYKDISEKIIIINCNIDMQGTIKRIKKRNRKKYDVDKMSEQELEKFLKLEQENILKIRRSFEDNKFAAISIDTTKNSDIIKNINEIIKNIEKKMINK